MGCCTSVATADGAYDPSPFAVSVAVKQKTDYKEESMELKHTDQAKILVVCTDDGRLKVPPPPHTHHACKLGALLLYPTNIYTLSHT